MRIVKVLTAAAVIASAAPASANVITFETATFMSQLPAPITEKGFSYKSQSGALTINNLGHPGLHIQGFASGGGGIMEISRAGGGDFMFDSLDFAAFGFVDAPTQTLAIDGLLNGSIVGSDQFTLANTTIFAPSYGNWTTELASLLAGREIDTLRIHLNAGTNGSDVLFVEAVDNVVLTPIAAVPEPATLALFGAGLLGFVAWRRRANA